MPTVHEPVARGECLGCHNPHGSVRPSLTLEASAEQLCARCHESVTNDLAFLHTPARTDGCLSCHAPHASRFAAMLDVVGADLCVTCHSDFAESLDGAMFVHKALD